MYSVMIVDDEVTIREKLPQIIDFERYGFTVCATAKNGEEALRMIPRYEPDLLLLDVRMPVMDGLSMLRHLRETEYRDLFVIILSGYSDFQYAKTAMEFGVKAYLTKPVDEDEAGRHLEEMRRALNRREHEKKRDVYHRDLTVLREAYDRRERTRLAGEYFILHIVPLGAGMESKSDHYRLISDTVLKRIGMEEGSLFQKFGYVYSFLIPRELAEDSESELYRFSSGLDDALRPNDLTCAFLFDTEALKAEELSFHLAYANHLEALLKELFFSSGNRFLRYKRPAVHKGGDMADWAEAFYSALRSGVADLDEEGVREAVGRLYSGLRARKPSLKEMVDLTNSIYYLLIGMVSSVEDAQVKKPVISKIEWVDTPIFRDFNQWKDLVNDQIKTIMAFLAQNRRLKRMGVSGEILEYVYQNYHSAISIKEVAEHFHMNPAYLGRVFQKATGVAFKQYVNELRISEARRMLLSTDKLIYEIANEIGFSDSSYFITKFTQEEGVSPMEYRKKR